MHLLAGKFAALAMLPSLFFGSHGNFAQHATPAHGQTKQNSHAALEVTSVSGPSALGISESGTWTVNVNMRTSTTTLHYSAVWGDEGTAAASLRTLAARTDTSATLSHSYATAGTYHPSFTVTDDLGHSVTKSTTVTVGAQTALHLTAVTPVSGTVGSTATLSGTGFTSSSTVTVGGVAATVGSTTTDGTISFTVPSLAAGTYNVRVHNGDRRSNPVSFTVTATAPSLSISGIDAPVALTAGTAGTWTVHAGTNSSNLHYGVVWGDEGSNTARMMTAATIQTSSTFTHTYQTPGTYTPKFTISDDAGHSESASASVVVNAQ